MGSALLNTLEDDAVAEVAGESSRTNAAEAGSSKALRQEVTERLAAHRLRRGGTQSRTQARLDLGPETPSPARTRSARIAATVADRYAQTQSYRAFLAAEAERAIQQANAAAEVATLNAQAVAAVQQRLLDAFDEADLHDAAHQDAAQNGEPPLHAGSAGHEDVREALQAEFQKTAGVELNLWPDLEPNPTPQHKVQHHSRPHSSAAQARTANLEPRAADLEPSAGLTVRLHQDSAGTAHIYPGVSRRTHGAVHANRYEERNDAESIALDEEIAFRQAPVFEEPAGPPLPLPANLIEFPRQLIASRKARPRYAEGPLRDETVAAPGDGQLRIFEVDPEQISTAPAAESATGSTAASQWTSIWLDTPEAAAKGGAGSHAMNMDADPYSGDVAVESRSYAAPPLDVAPVSRRIMAAAIDGAIVFAGLLVSVATFIGISIKLSGDTTAWQPGGSHLESVRQAAASLASPLGPSPNPALIATAVTGLFLLLLYQSLFFRFSEATLGMRCARIALCTFDDENPTRRAIRRRAAATLLSACPLGLGFLWAALDEDHLAWHDRITRMYLRSY